MEDHNLTPEDKKKMEEICNELGEINEKLQKILDNKGRSELTQEQKLALYRRHEKLLDQLNKMTWDKK